MNTYRVIVRTALAAHVCNIAADSTAEAAELAATQFASVPCGITVREPGSRALSILRGLITPDFASIAKRTAPANISPSGSNYTFLSGAVDAIRADQADRRFVTMPFAKVL